MPVLRHFANILDPGWFATPRPSGGVAARTARLLGCALLAALLALAHAAGAAAAENEVFTVGNVNVDRSARSAAAARDLALAEGQAEAFRRLVARLVPRANRGAVQVPAAEALAQLVQDFQVDQEKTSPVRYIAVMKVRFRSDAVQRLLRVAGVPFAVTPSRPVVVLPVYRRAGALLLWDQVNSWLQAWRSLPPAGGLVPMAVPDGDLADIADIGAEQALAMDSARISAIARRHGATGGMLAYATLHAEGGEGPSSVEISTARVGGGPERTLVQTITANPDENEESLLARAALTVREEVQESWRRDNLLRFDEHRRLVAVVPLSGIGDWVRLRRALDDLAVIERSELMQLARNEATVQLSYLGDEQQLVQALAQRDLSLARVADSWVLRVGPAPDGTGANAPAPQ